MSIAALVLVLSVAQMPMGTEKRLVYQSGRLLAQGIAMTEIVGRNGVPMIHYESLSVMAAPNGIPAHINSWSQLDGYPVYAEYTAGKMKYTAEVADGKVRFTSKNSESIVPLGKGKPAFESQIDPLALFGTSEDVAIPLCIIDVVNARVIEANLRKGGKAILRQGTETREGRRFRLDSGGTPGWITLDADGSFVSFSGENGMRMVSRPLR